MEQKEITAENFQEKWDFVSNKLIETKKKRLLEKVIAVAGNILFFVLFTFATFGILYKFEIKSLKDFLESQTLFAGGWNLLKPLLYHPDMNMGWNIVINILVCYIPVIILTAILLGIVWYVYKPNTGKVLSGNAVEDAKNLYKMAIEVKVRAKKPQLHASGILTFIYMVEVFMLVVLYIHYCMTVIKDMTPILKVMEFLFTSVGLSAAQLAVPAIGVVYAMVNTGLAYIVKLFYVTKYDETIIEDAKQFYEQADPEVYARILEENKILEQAKEIEARRKETNREFQEANIIEINPLEKKIKLGMRIATAVLVVGVLIWGVNTPAVKTFISYIDFDSVNFDIESYFNNGEDVESTEGTKSTEVTEVIEE